MLVDGELIRRVRLHTAVADVVTAAVRVRFGTELPIVVLFVLQAGYFLLLFQLIASFYGFVLGRGHDSLRVFVRGNQHFLIDWQASPPTT